jgi:hypothetical protein
VASTLQVLFPRKGSYSLPLMAGCLKSDALSPELRDHFFEFAKLQFFSLECKKQIEATIN